MRDSVKVLVMALSLAGITCGSSSGGKDLSKFKGTWQPTTYMATITCGGTPDVVNTGDNITWSGGVSTDLVQTDPTTNCVLDADVTGETASAISGQTCTVHDSSGDNIVLNLPQYTFSLSADGQTATEASSGTANVTFTDGTATVCQYSESASYHKITS